jgi:hypothetical protein
MSDTHTSGSADNAPGGRAGSDANFSGQAAQDGATSGRRFPWERLIYSLGFAVVAWFAFWGVLLLAIVNFVMIAINGSASADLRGFTRAWVRYLGDLASYIVGVRDEKPFPFGPLPRGE